MPTGLADPLVGLRRAVLHAVHVVGEQVKLVDHRVDEGEDEAPEDDVRACEYRPPRDTVARQTPLCDEGTVAVARAWWQWQGHARRCVRRPQTTRR